MNDRVSRYPPCPNCGLLAGFTEGPLEEFDEYWLICRACGAATNEEETDRARHRTEWGQRRECAYCDRVASARVVFRDVDGSVILDRILCSRCIAEIAVSDEIEPEVRPFEAIIQNAIDTCPRCSHRLCCCALPWAQAGVNR